MTTKNIDEIIDNTTSNINSYYGYIDKLVDIFKINVRVAIYNVLRDLDNMIKDHTLTNEEAAYYVEEYLNDTYDRTEEVLFYIIEGIVDEYRNKYKWIQ